MHIEIQGQHDAHFAERMFVYNYRIYHRHRRPVTTMWWFESIARTPTSCRDGLEGSRDQLHF